MIRSIFLLVLLGGVSLGIVSAQEGEDYNGKIINKVDENNLKQGPWIYFGRMKKRPGYGDDSKIEEGEFKDNRKLGIWISYFPDGQVKSEITFQSNRPKGPYKVYYPNGVLQEEGSWQSNRNVGTFKRFHENGKLQQSFNFNASGKREGRQEYYHENGQLMIEGDWNGGKEGGELKEYYANGELRSVKHFNDGSIDAAKTKTFEPQKTIAAVESTPTIEPPKDEPIKRTVVVNKAQQKPNVGYFDGNGSHTLYNKNKQISQKGIFKKGKLMDGKWYRYDDNGLLSNIEIYKNGVYVGEGVIEKDQR